jgi:hypothetical protein
MYLFSQKYLSVAAEVEREKLLQNGQNIDFLRASPHICGFFILQDEEENCFLSEKRLKTC